MLFSSVCKGAPTFPYFLLGCCIRFEKCIRLNSFGRADRGVYSRELAHTPPRRARPGAEKRGNVGAASHTKGSGMGALMGIHGRAWESAK
jgi:hypothetical protein